MSGRENNIEDGGEPRFIPVMAPFPSGTLLSWYCCILPQGPAESEIERPTRCGRLRFSAPFPSRWGCRRVRKACGIQSCLSVFPTGKPSPAKKTLACRLCSRSQAPSDIPPRSPGNAPAAQVRAAQSAPFKFTPLGGGSSAPSAGRQAFQASPPCFSDVSLRLPRQLLGLSRALLTFPYQSPWTARSVSKVGRCDPVSAGPAIERTSWRNRPPTGCRVAINWRPAKTWGRSSGDRDWVGVVPDHPPHLPLHRLPTKMHTQENLVASAVRRFPSGPAVPRRQNRPAYADRPAGVRVDKMRRSRDPCRPHCSAAPSGRRRLASPGSSRSPRPPSRCAPRQNAHR
jgi:hypothetical protein